MKRSGYNFNDIISFPKLNLKKISANISGLLLPIHHTKINMSPIVNVKKSVIVNRKTANKKSSKLKVMRHMINFHGRYHTLQTPDNIQRMVSILNQYGRCYIVGGWVRDKLLDRIPKDVDIEVHGMEIDQISHVLRNNGYKVDEVGKSFGVLKVKDPGTGDIIDVAVPRADSSGRKPDVKFLKTATPEDAARRRDFTINAIMFDTKDNKVVDPFKGIEDLEAGKIRHVSPDTFKDDPLRTVRAAQFASRFDFDIDEETKGLARDVDASQMAPERVTEEMRKVFEKSKKPSIFFRELDNMGQLDKTFPEVKKLQMVEQDPEYHPEGNAFNHTMDVMDRISASDKRKLILLVSALLHDIGKSSTSTIDPITQHIQSVGHEKVSEQEASKILWKYKFTANEIRDILSIIKFHMKPHSLVSNDAMKMKHKHGLMRDICGIRHMIKDPSGSIQKYCDVIDFAQYDHPKDEEKYEELKRLYPVEYYTSKVTGQDLYDQGYRGKEIGKRLEEIYISQINSRKDRKKLKVVKRVIRKPKQVVKCRK
jgi:tRNA nucleotidyltransferase (CCA-adding enzyme)